MIELSGGFGGTSNISFGGDTLNTAIGLARLGCQVGFCSALGADPWSEQLIASWQAEGLDCSYVIRHPARLPGLYGIHLDSFGERSFFYWRDNSAARDLFAIDGIEQVLARVGATDCLYISGITLSLYDRAGRQRLFDLAMEVRAHGGVVAFDGNYRARGWASAAAACAAIEAFAPAVSIALPTLQDECLLYGAHQSSLLVAERWHDAGVSEVVVKQGELGALVSLASGDQHTVPTRPVSTVVDSSGAGDAFNAGYLAARLGGASASSAAQLGNQLAGLTICHPGAIPPAAATAQLTIGAKP